MTPLETKQVVFACWVVNLIQQAQRLGFSPTLGEAWRSPETAALMAKEGKGISNSLHTLRLAIDINLWRGDKLLTDTFDYYPLGEWWEKQKAGEYVFSWGGRFTHPPDGNHFSFLHNGVR